MTTTDSLNQEPGKLDINMRYGDDLSFDINFGMDLTEYDMYAYVVSAGNLTEVPFTITNTDLATGKIHLFISALSIKDVPILENANRWYFKWNTPKQQIPAITVFKRTILAGMFNVTGK